MSLKSRKAIWHKRTLAGRELQIDGTATVAYWYSVGLAYHRYVVRFPARSLLGQVSHTQLQCSLIGYSII